MGSVLSGFLPSPSPELVAHFAGGHPDVRLALPDKSVNYPDFLGNANPANNGRSLTSMPASPRSSNQLEQFMAACDHPGLKLKFDEDHRFLREVVYVGLKDLNNGFDSPLIGRFSPADFLVVIDRCEPLHIRVIGIEVFASARGLREVKISPEDGYNWARRLVRGIREGLTSPSVRPSGCRRDQRPLLILDCSS
jgi:hypothetical protein